MLCFDKRIEPPKNTHKQTTLLYMRRERAREKEKAVLAYHFSYILVVIRKGCRFRNAC